MKADQTFALRRSVQPYVGLGVIIGGIAIWILVLAYRQMDKGTAESAVLLLGFYAAWVFLGMWYRIFLRENTITMRAFGKRNVSIAIQEISLVGTEVSDAKTLMKMNRPMRRIVIASVRNGSTRVIDVSLKHFVMADVRKLMGIIHSARPDLKVPAKWL